MPHGHWVVLRTSKRREGTTYSTYGHVATLAEEIKRSGAASVAGVEAKLCKVPETLSGEALAKMSARPKREDAPAVIAPAELLDADGFLFGSRPGSA
nr:unnamed protein product [Digitaria exilis]